MIHLGTWWLYSSLAVLVGMLLDFLMGDPGGAYHPICLIGNVIAYFDKKLREKQRKNAKKEFLAGAVTVGLVLLICGVLPTIILGILYSVSIPLGLVVESIMCFFFLSTRTLKKESMGVYRALKQDGLVAGQKAVARIVGRDTKVLDETGVIKACVETVAENASDGSIAPLFYMILGGAPLGLFYKCINTMDSMLGYKNDTYFYFGRVAAKLDDIANFIPARLSACYMILAAKWLKLDSANGYRIFKRDRYNHASPNSAQTEAVMAGVLHVQLAGDAYYFGKLYPKKTIGDADRTIVLEDISVACNLLYKTVWIGFIAMMLMKGVLFICMNMVGISIPM